MLNVADVADDSCLEARIADANQWQEVSDAKKLQELEAENAKLKRLYADALLDNQGLREC
jgi:hypothetical protein